MVAQRLRIPAIVLLLPVGFAAGAATADVRPDELLGSLFQPFVSLGVGLILFEAGLRLDLRELGASVRRVVVRLVAIGTLLTLVALTAVIKLIFGLGWGISLVLGAILVVSGPTVVLPLLGFIRPSDRVRSVLKWEGTLIDPIGALLGVIALHAVLQGAVGERPFHPGELASSVLIGLAIGLAAAVGLGAMLRVVTRATPGQGTAVALMAVAAAVVAADLLRDDAGLIAAAVMGMALARQDELDISRIVEFHSTVVELLIGVLFVLISASVTPAQVHAVLWKALLLVAVIVVVIRPLVVLVGTAGSALTWRERGFAAWMAPRGIVAGATASAFALALGEAGVAGAEKILPIVFVVIFATVVIYGLSGPAVARALGVAGAGAPVVLVVGGGEVARAVGTALSAAGARVRLWTGSAAERRAADADGLEAVAPPLGLDLDRLEAELEEVSEALVVSGSDDYNALVAYELRRELGSDRVYRLTPAEPPAEPVPAHAEGRLLFDARFSHPELEAKLAAGGRIGGSGGRDLYLLEG
ncbi:MAG: cation:proton antiporter [Actinobacteria bacterium]|nr:cation:proton antiporter [Actinomycetota bacterium]